MTDLNIFFDQRLSDSYNTTLIRNLEIIARAHEDRPIGYINGEDFFDPEDSSVADGERVKIDRTFDEIITPFSVGRDAVLGFATNHLVLDYGCGKSDFLNNFKDNSVTLAVDISADNLQTQAEAGHQTSKDIQQVENNSVKLLNASYSEPFWSLSPEHARGALRNFARVLMPGGIALIGSVTRPDIHTDWECTLDKRKFLNVTSSPWMDGDRAYMSHTLSAFIDEALKARFIADLNSGFLEVIGFRHFEYVDDDYRRRNFDIHVASHLMIRKL